MIRWKSTERPFLRLTRAKTHDLLGNAFGRICSHDHQFILRIVHWMPNKSRKIHFNSMEEGFLTKYACINHAQRVNKSENVLPLTLNYVNPIVKFVRCGQINSSTAFVHSNRRLINQWASEHKGYSAAQYNGDGNINRIDAYQTPNAIMRQIWRQWQRQHKQF